jgi:alginate O-acetyltransferase complex protein AlgJ
MQERSLSLISSSILSVCFLAALVLPTAETFLHFGPHIELSEKRILQNYPQFAWNEKTLLSYPARFEAAFNDHFGFRALLVRAQARAKFYWLRMSPSSKVVLGRDGWLYLAESMPEYRGVKRMPRATIQLWLQEFKAKKAFLESRSIKYLVVVAPNKETVYPEFLPPYIRQIQNRLYVDDFISALPEESRLNVLDLREPLIEAKSAGRLYLKTDSHWNQLGAAVARDAVIRRLATWLPDLQIQTDAHPFRTQKGKSGDLSQMMSLEDRMDEQAIRLLTGAKPVRRAALRSRPKVKGILGNEAVSSVDQQNHRNAIITGDSFSNAINVPLSGHFRRTLEFRPYLSYNDPLFKTIVGAEKPDVYLEILVDRHLANPPQVLSPEKKTSKL